MITDEMYREVSKGHKFHEYHARIDLSLDEINGYLKSKGYESHICNVIYTEYHGNSATKRETVHKQILSIKVGEEIPKYINSEEATDMHFTTVVKNELKKALLKL